MAYSKVNDALFIHIPKTAGKCIEQAVGMCTRQDHLKPRNRVFINRLATALQRMTKERSAEQRMWGVLDVTFGGAHLSLAEYQVIVSQRGHLPIRPRVIFSVVRNPFDRTYSLYRMLGARTESERGDPGKFEAWIRNYLLAPARNHHELTMKRGQVDFLMDLRGILDVDCLLRYENLEQEFENFRLTKLRKSSAMDSKYRSKAYRCSSVYTRKSRELVVERFREDFERLGYEMSLG